MFAKLHAHLTYANVVATIALFFAIGTGGVFAASKLKNNSVTSPKIKDGQVANVDLGSDAVTGPKVGDNSLTGADVAGLTGADVVGSSLQGVNAATVSGLQVRKIRFDIPYDDVSPATEVLNLGGLVITAVCRSFGDNLDVKAFTTKNGASVYLVTANTNADDTDPFRNFDGEVEAQGTLDPVAVSPSDLIEVDNRIPGGLGVVTLLYEAPDGSVVQVHLALTDANGTSCELIGMAIGG